MDALRSLQAARKAKGFSQTGLAARSGVAQGDVSSYETGHKSMGFKTARKLADALDTEAVALVVHNQRLVMDRAFKNGEAAGALKAAMDVVKASEQAHLTDDDERALDQMVARVVDFANKVGTHDDEQYGRPPGENRDLLGVKVSAKAADPEPTPYPLHPGHLDSATRDEIEDEDEIIDDGRDLYGFRVAPLPDRGD